MITSTFVLAGNSTFTIKSPDGTHRTYKVERVEGNDRFPKPAYFVKTLTGPDNTNDYTYLGKLDDFTGQVVTTAKSKSWEGTMRLRLLNRVLLRVWGNEGKLITDAGYDVMHAGTCGRCGRKLTTPDSLETGIGPECRKILGIEVQKAEPKPEAYTGPKCRVRKMSPSNAA